MRTVNQTFALWVIVIIFASWYLPPLVGRSNAADEVEQLIKQLSDDLWQTRWDAAAALGETKDPRAVDPLIVTLKDENSYVRMTAARSLGMIGDKRAINALIASLKEDDSHGVQKNAVLALKQLTGQDFGKDPDKWQKWWDQTK
jgi:HEAT repeat protein